MDWREIKKTEKGEKIKKQIEIVTLIQRERNRVIDNERAKERKREREKERNKERERERERKREGKKIKIDNHDDMLWKTE